MYRYLVAASFNTLYRKTIKQFSNSVGLHLNSKDWKPYIKLGNASFYNFLINGVVKTNTKTKTNDNSYDQVIQFDNFKEMENALLFLYLIDVPENDIKDFIAMFLFNSRTRFFCTCPAFKFWGFEYILTKQNSVFGIGEFRPPVEKNPHMKGVFCKHLWVICDSLNTKKKEFVAGLVPFYKRAFGINSDKKIQQFKKQLNPDGIFEILEEAKLDIKKIRSETVTKFFNKIIDIPMQNINKKKVKTSKETENKEKQLEPFVKGLNRIYKDYGVLDETADLDKEALGIDEEEEEDIAETEEENNKNI